MRLYCLWQYQVRLWRLRLSKQKASFVDKFRQLDEALPTPNVYRSAAGEPGEKYWQQRVNYDIDVTAR